MNKGPKEPTQRQLRVGEELKHALSNLFMRGDMYGPNNETLSVTVAEVRVSPDMRNATVYVMPLGGKNPEEVLGAINEVAPRIQTTAAREVHMRYFPRLHFKLDDTFENASRMEELLRSTEISRDTEQAAELEAE